MKWNFTKRGHRMIYKAKSKGYQQGQADPQELENKGVSRAAWGQRWNSRWERWHGRGTSPGYQDECCHVFFLRWTHHVVEEYLSSEKRSFMGCSKKIDDRPDQQENLRDGLDLLVMNTIRSQKKTSPPPRSWVFNVSYVWCRQSLLKHSLELDSLSNIESVAFEPFPWLISSPSRASGLVKKWMIKNWYILFFPPPEHIGHKFCHSRALQEVGRILGKGGVGDFKQHLLRGHQASGFLPHPAAVGEGVVEHHGGQVGREGSCTISRCQVFRCRVFPAKPVIAKWKMCFHTWTRRHLWRRERKGRRWRTGCRTFFLEKGLSCITKVSEYKILEKWPNTINWKRGQM